jgi:hypothetical protein
MKGKWHVCLKCIYIQWYFKVKAIVVTYEIRVFFEGAQKEVVFKYFFKSPKKRKIRVCLKILRVCHYYGESTLTTFIKEYMFNI